jgi:Fe-S-cluster containining protein
MKKKSLARANGRIRQLVMFMHQQVDREHDKPQKQISPGGMTVQCTDGCAHAPTGCCSLLTLVEQSEADYIASRNPEALARAAPRLVANEKAAVAAGISGPMLGKMFETVALERKMAAVYHQLALPCAFLDLETRRCTVYQDRPLACRTHFVLSDPALCSSIGVEEQHITLDKGTRSQAQAIFLQMLQPLAPRFRFGTLNHAALAALGLADPDDCFVVDPQEEPQARVR